MLLPLRLSFRLRPAAFFHQVGRGLTLAVCTLFSLSNPLARGDIQQPPRATGRGDRAVRRQEPPATAMAGHARVTLDGSVEIVLSSEGGEGKEVDFIIRDEPAHGTLAGPPRQLTRTTAAVTYLHRFGDGADADRFTFAVQARGGKVSAAAPVLIAVTDAAPELAVTPAELDFGAVKVGDTIGAEMTVENRGGGVALGRMFAPLPWEVDGPADYHLARGESQKFRVVFRPDRGYAFAETWRFAGEDGHATVRLVGTGLGSPIAIPDTSGRALPSDSMAAGTIPAASPLPAPAPADSPVNSAPPPLPATTPSVADRAPAVAAVPVAPVEPPDPDPPLPDRAQVTAVEARHAGSSAVDLSWNPPVRPAHAYRVEMRYILFPAPEDENRPGEVVPPRIEWRPYGSTDIRARASEVTAHVRGLSEMTIYALRVVAMDASGHAASPSPVVFVRTGQGSAFWRLTPLKVLCALLVSCAAIYVWRRWQERRMLVEETEELERSLFTGG